ncbi:MAG: acetylornithine deacetylase [Acetobacteraceae bacterium]|nr:acetylornithine deacetylase [Acetobacteraceae bacterium]
MIEAAETLARLVAFPTVAGEPNAALIGWLAEQLSELGARVRVLDGAQAGRANLFASLGPDSGDGIVLSAHSDVVPVAGQDWSSDPFALTERTDGRLHARGAVDMKGFLACALAAAARAADPPLGRPLHLAVSHDEELGCVGVRTMLDTLAREGFRASGCIVGEPTDMQVVLGHKGKLAGRILCLGEAAHSANPARGCNAINLAAAMVRQTERLQRWLREHGVWDDSYEVPSSTVHIGTIQGGTALNVVPDRCEMAFEMRLVPGEEPESLLGKLRRAARRVTAPARAGGRNARVEIEVGNAYPGLAMPDGGPFVAFVRSAAPVRSSGRERVDFGTEGGLFRQRLGLPTVVCGPGSIGRAHRADEYITRAELAARDAFLDRILETLAA